MSVKVRVPNQLQNVTGGEGLLEANAATARELIDNLEAKHPGIRERLLDDSGNLRRFINLYLNDEDIRFLNDLDTQVNDGDTVSIIPAVAGG